ncbi:MAG: sensor histidine kinase [Verrucomicrobiaceae bacterium]
MKIPLSLRIFLMLLMNVVLVGGILWWVAVRQYGLQWQDFAEGTGDEKIAAMAETLSAGLESLERDEWTPVIARFEKAHQVDLGIWRPRGEELVEGTKWEVGEKEETLFQGPGSLGPGDRGPRDRGPGRGPGPPGREPWEFDEFDEFDDGPPGPPGRDRPPRGEEEAGEPEYLGLVSTDHGHVAGVRLYLRETKGERKRGMVLLIREKAGSSLFFTWTPLLIGLGIVVVVSLLIWVPWVYRVTRRLGILTRGAESISQGDFKVDLTTGRKDEIGRLSRSLQAMAGKLDELVSGQKRFLGDIAHELCSPLVRMRMGLGVLEHKLEAEDYEKLESVNAEVEELSQLVNELLDFSKASLKPESLPVSEVNLAQLCEEVILREGGEGQVGLRCDAGLRVMTNDGMLKRALGNVVRNGLNYASDIEVEAKVDEGRVSLVVSDRGPGIAPEWIEKIFEPFTRPDRARTREAGGAGLGMAIAKTCIESLGGSILCENREGGGLRVVLRFPGG